MQARDYSQAGGQGHTDAVTLSCPWYKFVELARDISLSAFRMP